MSKVAILGGGGHARVMAAIICELDTFELIGFTDPDPQAQVPGLKHLGRDCEIEVLSRSDKPTELVLGIGMLTTVQAEIRRRLYEHFDQVGLQFPTLVSPQAVVDSDVVIGSATTVSASATLITGTTIGIGSIVNTRAVIDHDCRIGNFNHIAPGAVLNGGVRIANDSIIGSGAVILEGVSIPSTTVIGAGAVVIRDIDEPGTYVGVPARRLPGYN